MYVGRFVNIQLIPKVQACRTVARLKFAGFGKYPAHFYGSEPDI
jgi:hypothetical protein